MIPDPVPFIFIPIIDFLLVAVSFNIQYFYNSPVSCRLPWSEAELLISLSQ